MATPANFIMPNKGRKEEKKVEEPVKEQEESGEVLGEVIKAHNDLYKYVEQEFSEISAAMKHLGEQVDIQKEQVRVLKELLEMSVSFNRNMLQSLRGEYNYEGKERFGKGSEGDKLDNVAPPRRSKPGRIVEHSERIVEKGIKKRNQDYEEEELLDEDDSDSEEEEEIPQQKKPKLRGKYLIDD